MKPRVLITGGAGFVGSHLTDRLLAAGYTVRILDILDQQVHPRGAPPWLAPEAELQIGSVLDPAALDRALDHVEAVVHCAAVVGVGQSQYQWARYTATNLLGTAELLQALLRRRRGSGVGRLLLAGSMSIYGEGRYWCPACQTARLAPPRPLERLRRQLWEPACPDCGGELVPRPTGEDKAPQLASVYSITKQAQEEFCRHFGRTYGVGTTVLRFFNIFGPRQALTNPYTGVAAVFAAELLAGRRPHIFEDGLQLRDFISVHDVVAACQTALEASGQYCDVLNIASGTPVSVLALAEALGRALDQPLAPIVTGRYRVGDARHCFADTSAARARLGFEPKIGLENGLRELGEWLRAQPLVPTPAPRQETAYQELALHGLTI